MYVSICDCMNGVYICLHECEHLSDCMYVCICMCMFMCICFIYVHINVCMCLFCVFFVCMYLFVCIYYCYPGLVSYVYDGRASSHMSTWGQMAFSAVEMAAGVTNAFSNLSYTVSSPCYCSIQSIFDCD
jgi:hypothetical protein